MKNINGSYYRSLLRQSLIVWLVLWTPFLFMTFDGFWDYLLPALIYITSIAATMLVVAFLYFLLGVIVKKAFGKHFNWWSAFFFILIFASSYIAFEKQKAELRKKQSDYNQRSEDGEDKEQN